MMASGKLRVICNCRWRKTFSALAGRKAADSSRVCLGAHSGDDTEAPRLETEM